MHLARRLSDARLVHAMKSIDPGDLDARDAYQLVISAIVPRPIALVSTISDAGVANISPFSFFMAVSSKPPILALSIARGREREKDTMRNIRQTRELVVNIVDRKISEAAVASAASFEPHVSEFSVVGLTPLPSDKVRAPRVAESPIQLECVATELIERVSPNSRTSRRCMPLWKCDPTAWLRARAAPRLDRRRGRLDIPTRPRSSLKTMTESMISKP